MTLLSSPEEIARRRALLQSLSHAPLAAYAVALREQASGLVPNMDPLDGGTGARVLLLLEKPGPGAARSGFVSRDNPSPTSATIRSFLDEAGLPRDQTLLWNTVPGWNGTIHVTGAEVRAGLGCLAALLPLLPNLDTIILAGSLAARAEELLSRTGLRLIRSAHPSPQVRAAFPQRWAEIPSLWAQARQ